MYVVQDQVNTLDLTEYAWLFSQSRSQAVAVNAAVQVDAEVGGRLLSPPAAPAAPTWPGPAAHVL